MRKSRWSLQDRVMVEDRRSTHPRFESPFAHEHLAGFLREAGFAVSTVVSKSVSTSATIRANLQLACPYHEPLADDAHQLSASCNVDPSVQSCVQREEVVLELHAVRNVSKSNGFNGMHLLVSINR